MARTVLPGFLLCAAIQAALAQQLEDGGSDECPLVQVRAHRPAPSVRCKPNATKPGASVPLDLVSFNSKGDDFIGFGINVTPSTPIKPALPGMPVPPQRLLFDLGSSTIGFCNAIVANQAASTSKYVTCVEYGAFPNILAWWGFMYSGGLDLLNNVSLDTGHYGVMQTEFFMPCTDDFNGIFGAAFQDVNFAWESFTPLQWSSTLDCPEKDQTLASPFIDTVRGEYGSLFGISWSGKRGDQEGRLYLGSEATKNSVVDGGESAGKVRILPGGVYVVNITGYSFDGVQEPWTCKSTEPCIVDSGNPSVGFPSEINKQMKEKGKGKVTIQLEGVDGKQVALELDVAELLAKDGWVDSGSVGVIGLPVFAFYYMLFDINVKSPTIDFIKQPQSFAAAEGENSAWSGAYKPWPRLKV